MRSRHESFACAPGLRLEAHERVSKLQFDALTDRFQRLETLMERLERRLWLTVYGVAAAILADVFQGLLSAAP
ncbi:hypothetical protein KUW09_16690 [Mameliella alba]|nr:hypothetical protein [Mameliella sediminis]MBY6115447.1 hypothetical protein [Antarctobacter heliothermus]MBY6145694.1 hypothetical protein [Mameliella alba]MBY6161017.1 hypothetical protein [Mameliella alba]MBY6169487.1 hypothetical protein [Mameliella alba]MBY6174506.1 hypothetical protein [Mameliella alba]